MSAISDQYPRAASGQGSLPIGRVCLFGAAPDTGNLGVSALCYAVLGGLARVRASAVTVFDFGRGARRASRIFYGRPFEFERCGAAPTRRFYRSESLWNIGLCSRFGGLANPAARRILASDLVLDISGGDSFSDIYGERRFRAIVFPKRLALRLAKPLILLPQTYGPYIDARAQQQAGEIVRRVAQAWARDPVSYETLRELAGPEFDPARHRCGVDVAFALEPAMPRAPLPEPVCSWLSDDYAGELIAVNVSGLLWHDPRRVAQYGFKSDYRECILEFLRCVLKNTDAAVLLVPHVLTPEGHYESDAGANGQVLAALGDESGASRRVCAVPPVYDCDEMKWIISRCSWFCGTRMHATIAALSSQVPCCILTYSDKAMGVFADCGVAEHLVDPRRLEQADVVDSLWDSYLSRAKAKSELRLRIPAIVEAASQQFDQICSTVTIVP